MENSVSLRYPAQACILFPGEKQKGEHQNEKAYFFIAAGLRAGPNPHARRFCGGIRPHRRIPRDGLYVTIRPFAVKTPGFQFEYAWYNGFQGGYFPVKGEYSTRHGQAYGLVDTSGNVVTQSWFLGGIPSYKVDNGIFKFWDGEASTRESPGLPLPSERLYGYRTVDGNVIVEPQYSSCYDFSDGRAVVVERNPAGNATIAYKIIDTTGKTVFS